ncbi:LuxR C-terminal-related transcriptional regulator [Streptomyces bambusae]|uniref:Response regulator n=1 Tax=Streptomyces bambusae TaxID=1550616 RepID=A0ABS6ZA16_9ACTN|nr:response regulator transcription factor [Streptomyces bambusae]MBW5484609.1 response regulator [Streptomyces bambusae]
MAVKLVVFHEEDLVRAALLQILQRWPETEAVVEAADADQAVRAAETIQPALVIMEANGRTAERAAVIRAIKQQSHADVLMLTEEGRDRDALRLLGSGAVGWLYSSATADELIHAAQQIISGNGFIDPAAVRTLVESVADHNISTGERMDEGRLRSELTSRELEVMEYVSQGLSNQQIASRLAVSENTVKTHVSRTLNKLGMRSRVEAALAVRSLFAHSTTDTRSVVPKQRGNSPTCPALPLLRRCTRP